LYVTHSVTYARPMVTFPAHASTKLIVLGHGQLFTILRPSQSVRTMSQSPEPPTQALSYSLRA